VRAELVAVLRGASPAEVVRAVERHTRTCAACAAERESLRRTMELVAGHVHPEVSADARLRLRSLVDEELARPRPRTRRRILRPSFALPAALAAGALVAWLAASSASSPPPSGGADSAGRLERAVARAGEFGPKSLDAVSRGLDWLAARQRPDGTWAPAADSDAETTAAATALALLAFAADGQSPHHGPNSSALASARDRLKSLAAAGFSPDEDRKPLYALSLAVRAFAAGCVLDRDAMTPVERREARAVAESAGRELRGWQRADGGFGYAPHAARSDSSCTLFAAAALTDLREAGVLDAAGALSRANAYLDSLRGADGTVAYERRGDRAQAPALTAALLALGGADAAPARDASPVVLASIERETARGGDTLLSWTGAEALARHGRSLESPVRSLLATQRRDGAWAADADARCAAGGDTVTTAFGVLALAQTYAR
jgi:hypothetical protein